MGMGKTGSFSISAFPISSHGTSISNPVSTIIILIGCLKPVPILIYVLGCVVRLHCLGVGTHGWHLYCWVVEGSFGIRGYWQNLFVDGDTVTCNRRGTVSRYVFKCKLTLQNMRGQAAPTAGVVFGGVILFAGGELLRSCWSLPIELG